MRAGAAPAFDFRVCAVGGLLPPGDGAGRAAIALGIGVVRREIPLAVLAYPAEVVIYRANVVDVDLVFVISGMAVGAIGDQLGVLVVSHLIQRPLGKFEKSHGAAIASPLKMDWIMLPS